MTHITRYRAYWLLLALLAVGTLHAFAGTPPAPVETPSIYNPEKMSDAAVFEDQAVNIAVFRWINNHHHPIADSVARFFDTLGIPFEKWGMHVDIGIGWVLIPIFLFAYHRRRHLFGALFLGLLIETLLIVICKEFTSQPRPAVLLPDVHEVMRLRSNSFPSGHTAMVAVIAGIMMYREHWLAKCWWVFFVAIIAYQRIYAGVHFPLDIAAGLLIGVVAALITLRILGKKIERYLAKKQELPAEGIPAASG